jgi:hypothetical protein
MHKASGSTLQYCSAEFDPAAFANCRKNAGHRSSVDGIMAGRSRVDSSHRQRRANCRA